MEKISGLQQKKFSILDSMENQIRLAQKLQGVYDDRPDIEDFVDAMTGTKFAGEYTSDKIKSDVDYVNIIKQKIEKETEYVGQRESSRLETGFALSEMMQAMIVDQINKGWLKDFKSIMTSDYDDLKVGIDAVVKHKGGEYLGAAFDFTASSEAVTDKLQKEWDRNVSSGSIPTVKYFKDPDSNEKGRLTVPKFIIGVSKKDVEEFAKAYLDGKEEALASHSFKYLIIRQIDEQLGAINYFYTENKANQKFKFAEKKYKKITELIEKLKKDIGYDEFRKDNLDFHQYSKESFALGAMEKFFAKKNEELGIFA